MCEKGVLKGHLFEVVVTVKKRKGLFYNMETETGSLMAASAVLSQQQRSWVCLIVKFTSLK